ncbi:MAG: hypothetical protein LC779_12635 [Actinobacteria bacterium]|nr:hypothetical protein [Actinomycetota bacterium]
MRVYLPSTLPALRRLLETGQVGDPPLPAFAVTGALREWYAEGGDEELEYAALALAAQASLRLLDADPDAPPRRAVVVAEVPDGVVVPAPAVDRGAVHVGDPVPMRLVRSVHVDDPSAEDDVRTAVESVVAADLGSEDAAFAVEQAEGHELQWYASQELGPLLELS